MSGELEASMAPGGRAVGWIWGHCSLSPLGRVPTSALTSFGPGPRWSWATTASGFSDYHRLLVRLLDPSRGRSEAC